MKKQLTRSLIIILLNLLTSSLTVRAQERPDFSGSWKVNQDKSDFGGPTLERLAVIKITHKEPSFHWATIVNNEIKDEFSFTTDGKKSMSKVGNIERTDEAKWEGATLLQNTEIREKNGELRDRQDRLTLSKDGKTLTIVRHVSSGQIQVDFQYVYDRQ